MSTIEGPEDQFLADNARYFKQQFGLTEEQLQGVRFNFQRGGEEFPWPVYAEVAWPEGLSYEQVVWCALRWLILDKPPASRETRAAWDMVTRYAYAVSRPEHRAGKKQLDAVNAQAAASHAVAVTAAQNFALSVQRLCEEHPDWNKTRAVTAAAKDAEIAVPTAWRYLRIAGQK